MADQEYVQNHEERGEDRDDSDDFPPSAELSRAITAFDPTQAQSPHQRKARGRTLGPLWDKFHVGDRKNPSHMWAVCRACATNGEIVTSLCLVIAESRADWLLLLYDCTAVRIYGCTDVRL